MDLFMRFIDQVAILASPIVGSFIGCVVDRSAKGESATWTRSKCESCQFTLGARDLVPVLSYLALRGRCRSCNATIPFRLIRIETVATVSTALIISLCRPHQALFATALVWLLLALAAYDVVHRRLPNVLNATLCATGLLWTVVADGLPPHHALIGALAGAGAAFALANGYRLATTRDGLGLGDVKLFGASGAWVGWQGLPALMLISSLAAILVMASTGPLSRHRRHPFGPYIAFGTIAIWSWQQAHPVHLP